MSAKTQRADILRLGFLSAHDPYDRRAFSGTAFHAMRALAGREDLDLVVPGWTSPGPLASFTRRIRSRRMAPAASLDLAGFDALVALVSSDLVDALPPGHPPLLHVTDATPAFLREFYGFEVPQEADRREARVLARAALGVYSSAYMARRAEEEFDLPPGRARHLSFGVNLDNWPGEPPQKGARSPLRLLFVGTDWHRKGGDIALSAVMALRARGIDARLDLVGASPGGDAPDGVVAHGYLDKNRPVEARRLEELFAAAHLFILPTRADCTPMVIAEAGVHATPVLVAETGGIASLIETGENGRMMPPGATPEDWADAIAAMTSDADSFAELSQRAHRFATTHLTWEAWAASIALLAREVAR